MHMLNLKQTLEIKLK